MINTKSLILLLIVIIFLIVTIFVIYMLIKNNNKNNVKLTGNEKLEKISYNYAGTAIGDIYTYEIYKENNEVKLKVDIMNINSENPDIVVLNENILDEIMELIKKYNVNKMNGFHKNNPDVLDGSSFAVSIKLSNDKEISFSGSNISPNGFHGFEKEFLNLIKEETTNIKNKYQV